MIRTAIPITVLCAAAMTAAGAAQPTAPQVSVQSDTLRVTSSGRSVYISLKSPAFTIGDSTVAASEPIARPTWDPSAGPMKVEYRPIVLQDGAKLDVKLTVAWSPEDGVLRKWASYRITGNPAVVKEIVLDDIDAGNSKVWSHGGLHGSADGYFVPDFPQSHPFFMDGFFLGVEYPVAASRLDGRHIVIAQKPGLAAQPGKWYETRREVVGVAEPGFERRTFEKYIEAHRPKPRGLHVNYNSWWTSPVPYTENDILGLMNTFETKMFRPYGASFDTFCIDMGWSVVDKVWQIDHASFPDEFKRIRDAADAMDCSLGVWISPSNCYSPGSFDNEIAEKNGYESFLRSDGAKFMCLGGPKYAEQFKRSLVDMVTRYGVKHYKLDGYVPTCTSKEHGHEPDELSAEPVAEGMIAALQAARKAGPNVWMEPTCFGYNPSPWWLFYTNSVIGTYGDDAPNGRVPCPVYRESYTSARDYFNLQGAGLLPIPIAAQEVLGLDHQSTDPFMNDGVITVLRGHMFLPVYLNPKFMDDTRWRSLAGLINWARANSKTLSQTVALLPTSWQDGNNIPRFTANGTMPREPYGYAHIGGRSGLIALRNPWVEPQTYSVKLDKFIGLSPDASGLAAVSVYPQPRVYGRSLKYGDTLDVKLAPYETLVLSIGPKQKTAGVPDAADSVLNAIRVDGVQTSVKKLEFTGDAEPFGPSWTSLVGAAKSSVRLDLNAKVHAGDGTRLLILLEGKSKSPIAPDCRVMVNGKPVQTEITASDAGWTATVLPTAENWTFVTAEIPAGDDELAVSVLANDDAVKTSAWLWTTQPGNGEASYPNALPTPETISVDGKQLLAPTDLTAAATESESAERPVERIEGIFLDAIEPASVEQAWGSLQKNQSVWEKPMVIGGQRYIRGLGTHAPGKIVYALDGKYKRFQAWAGADGNNGPTITLEVLVDGKKVWESGLMTRDLPAKRIDIDVTGAKTLELIAGDGGNGNAGDHTDWADARLLF